MRTEDGRIEQQKARARQLDEGDECGEGRDDIWPGASDTPLAGKLVEGAGWRSPCDLICQRRSPVRRSEELSEPVIGFVSTAANAH